MTGTESNGITWNYGSVVGPRSSSFDSPLHPPRSRWQRYPWSQRLRPGLRNCQGRRAQGSHGGVLGLLARC